MPRREELRGARDVYAARVSLALERLDVFQIRGRARLDGPNLAAEGPFVLWGDAGAPLLRADFYGPDGHPVVSLRSDTTGSLVYYPDEGRATFYPDGFPLGDALLDCSDLVCLVRTGFPLRLPQWVISLGGATAGSAVTWTVVSLPEARDTMEVELSPGSAFPSMEWEDGRAEITSASPGDIYTAWPTSWRLSGAEKGLDMAIRSIEEPDPPPPAVWSLDVPVPVDSVPLQRRWGPAWHIPDR